jgi:hypothetical protein
MPATFTPVALAFLPPLLHLILAGYGSLFRYPSQVAVSRPRR